MKKYNIWYEEPEQLDEELLEVCRSVATGETSYFLILEETSWEIPMSNEIYRLMDKASEKSTDESEAIRSADVKNVCINDFVADVVNSIRNSLSTDDYKERYYCPKCLIVCSVEEISGKEASMTALEDILGWRVKNGKKTILIGTQKDRGYSKNLLAVLKQIKTVHIEYAERQ